MILLADNLHGQEKDSMDNTSYFKDFYNIIERQKDFYYQPDSLLQEAFFYDRIKQFEVFTPRSGNLGSAHLDFFEKFQNKKIFSDGFTQYDGYFLDPFRKKTNSALRRFSNINYHIGSKKEQHLVVRHEQKIRPWMIMGLDLAAITSEGDFSQTIHKNREFDLYFSYESRSGVYRGYVSYTANRVLNEESGGISDDAVFENASFLNTKTLPINLQSGETKHRTRDYVLKQELNLSRLFGKRDSVSPSNSFKNGSFVLHHSLWWNQIHFIPIQKSRFGLFQQYLF